MPRAVIFLVLVTVIAFVNGQDVAPGIIDEAVPSEMLQEVSPADAPVISLAPSETPSAAEPIAAELPAVLSEIAELPPPQSESVDILAAPAVITELPSVPSEVTSIQTAEIPSQPAELPIIPSEAIEAPFAPSGPAEIPFVPSGPVELPSVPSEPVELPSVPSEIAEILPEKFPAIVPPTPEQNTATTTEDPIEAATQFSDIILAIVSARVRRLRPGLQPAGWEILENAKRGLDRCEERLRLHHSVWQYRICAAVQLRVAVSGIESLQSSFLPPSLSIFFDRFLKQQEQ